MARVEEPSARETAARLTDSVSRYLLALGFRVEAPAKLRGESGAEHTASLSATADPNARVILDAYSSGEKIGEEEVINTYTKVLDTSPSRAYIVCLPGATDLARKLAGIYKIGLVEGSSIDEIVGNLGLSSIASAAPRRPALDPSMRGFIKCRRCGYAWRTRSEARYVTCPSCFDKVTRVRPAARVILQSE